MSYTAAMPAGQEMARYRTLRQVLAPEYAAMPGADIRALMEHRYGPGAAEYYDEFFEGIFGDVGRAFSSAAKDVGRVATQAAPAVAQIGGGALQGAMAGAALGPVGIIGGAALGGTAAGLSRYGKGTARDVGGVLSGVTGAAGQFTPLGRIGAAAGPAIGGLAGPGGLRNAGQAALGALGGAVGGGGGAGLGALSSVLGGGGAAGGLGALGGLVGGGRGQQALGALGGLLAGGNGGAAGGGLGALASLFGGTSALGQLSSLVRRPEIAHALAASSMGQMGRPTIPVGSAQTPVPVGAFINLLGQLANQAAAEAAALGDGAEAELRYMTDESGEFVGDPALDRDRAARLWDLLNLAQGERLGEAVLSYHAASEAAYDELVAEAEQEADELAYYEAMEIDEAEMAY